MYLTKEEEQIYEGEQGWTLQKAMQILVAIGELNGAERLIPIKSAHVSGASYKTIGDAYEFVERLQGRVAVKTTLNPVGMDLERWREMHIDEDFAKKQRAVLSAYEKLGILAECTCVPYEIPSQAHPLETSLASSPFRPREGEHIAWSESSAVIFANSVLGARTNMEGAPSALAAALLGKTPLYGLHIPENRNATVKLLIRDEISDADFGALGLLTGEIVGDCVPLFEFKGIPSEDELKQLAAGIGATGSVGIFHVKGVTPEAKEDMISEVVHVERSQLRDFLESCGDAGAGVGSSGGGEPDVVAIGCPHCSLNELRRIYKILKEESRRSRRSKVALPFFIFTARAFRGGEIVRRIENFGVKVFCDTCFVVSPAFERFSCILTNSGKMWRYAPLLSHRHPKVILASTEECVKRAFSQGKFCN